MRRTLLMLAALVAMAAVTLAACGGSSSKASSSASGGSGNFCNLLKHDNNNKALTGQPTNLPEAKKQVQAIKTAFDQLAGAAPSQIKSDMQSIQSYSNDLAKSVKSATTEKDFTSKAQAVQSKHKGASAAQQKVSAFAKQHCSTSTGSGG